MAMKPAVRERIRAEMLPLVEAWRTSGETRRAFATRHGISISKFDYWTRQMGAARPRATRGAPPGFAALDVMPPPHAPGVIEIVLVGGDRVVVHAEAEVSLVRAVVTALGRRC